MAFPQQLNRFHTFYTRFEWLNCVTLITNSHWQPCFIQLLGSNEFRYPIQPNHSSYIITNFVFMIKNGASIKIVRVKFFIVDIWSDFFSLGKLGDNFWTETHSPDCSVHRPKQANGTKSFDCCSLAGGGGEGCRQTTHQGVKNYVQSQIFKLFMAFWFQIRRSIWERGISDHVTFCVWAIARGGCGRLHPILYSVDGAPDQRWD